MHASRWSINVDRAKAFYDTVLATLGVPAGFVHRNRISWRTPAGTRN